MSGPSVCLNMIVKNEAHVIEKTLANLVDKMPQLRYWVISDTGSTDGTQDIIRSFFARKNIPGELFEDPWRDFGFNRTRALEHAFNKTDFVLVFDADDEICGHVALPTTGPLADAYHFNFGSEYGVSYTRVLLMNNRKQWVYVGVLHELLQCKDPDCRYDFLTGNYYVVSGKSGSRSRNPNKYLEDAQILEKAYEEAKARNDDIYVRYTFYCANSYFDCGQNEKAIEWYKKTFGQSNWIQEKYVACWRIYQCYERMGRETEGFYYLVEAIQYDSERGECLFHLICHYCCKQMNNVAYAYYSTIRDFYENRYLKVDSAANKLFVDTAKLSMHLPYYMILVADKMQDFKTVIHMYRVIFTKKHKEYSRFFVGNMLYNLQFFIDKPEAANDPDFYRLFREYVDFLHSYNFGLEEYDHFMSKYEKYGVTVPLLQKKQHFTPEQCRHSNKVLFYVGFSNEPWNFSTSFERALGGSESAVAYLTEQFDSWYDIVVAGDVKPETVGTHVRYMHLDQLHQYVKSVPFHTIVVSRYVSFFELFPEFSAHQVYIWGHDMSLIHYGAQRDVSSILHRWNRYITGCVCQTEWHKNLYASHYPLLRDRFHIINNGIRLSLFPPVTEKVPDLFVYSSCSERGLKRLLEIWPDILQHKPHAQLRISSYNPFPKKDDVEEAAMQRIIEAHPTSIQHLGRLSKKELYALMASAEYWLYPNCYNETSCITSLEMMINEVICLYYPNAGLVDTIGDYGVVIHHGNEVEKWMALTEEDKARYRQRGKEYATSCSWQNRYRQWDALLFGQDIRIKETETEMKQTTTAEERDVDPSAQPKVPA